MKQYPFAERLIYALDINFKDCETLAKAKVMAQYALDKTLEQLAGTGITIKGNTIFRVLGIGALEKVEDAGFGIFADYKLFDVQGTIDNDLSWLRFFEKLRILTICEDVHPIVFDNVANFLQYDSIVAPVNPLTDLSDKEFAQRGQGSRAEAVGAFFDRVVKLPATGVISSPADIAYGPKNFAIGRRLITPAIRPAWSFVENDTNAINALTPFRAIIAGATDLVLGAPMRHKDDLAGNAIRVLDEMALGFAERTQSTPAT